MIDKKRKNKAKQAKILGDENGDENGKDDEKWEIADGE